MITPTEPGWREPMLATLTQRPFSGGNSLFVKFQRLLSTGSMFGQEDVGVGAVRTNGECLFRKIDAPRRVL